MVVVFSSSSSAVPSEVKYWTKGSAITTVTGSGEAYSQLMWIARTLIHPDMGAPGATVKEILGRENTTRWAARAPFAPYGRGASYKNPTEVVDGIGAYNNPQMVYTSPVIHTVTLTGLVPGTTYYYTVANDLRNFTFVMPPNGDGSASVYPFTVAMTADLGQTDISAQTKELLKKHLRGAEKGSVMLLSGDLSYADGYYPRWDTWARFMEDLATEFPIMTVGGNHEYGDGEAWVSYNARYPMPYQQSGSVSNLWWSRDVGPVHLIGLCSYAETAPGSLQYEWLSEDLSSIDRSVTPWVIVMMHAPWYNSNSGHRAEAELMRQDMEALLVNNGVDVVLNGHVHAYERILPVYNGCRTACGPVYLGLGNGGNREGAYLPWLFPKPFYSAFRASTFGPGLLVIHNSTHAYYNFTRVGCQSKSVSENFENLDGADCTTTNFYGSDNSPNASDVMDTAWIVRPLNRLAGCSVPSCAQPAVPPTSSPNPGPTPNNGGNGKNCDNEDSAKVWAIVGATVAALIVGTAVGMFLGRRTVLKSIRPHSVVHQGLVDEEEDSSASVSM